MSAARRQRRTRALGIVACAATFALCGLAVGAERAAAALYWGNWSGIGRTEPDRAPEFNLSSPVWRLNAPSSTCGLGVDATHVYWADSYNAVIGRVRLDGQAYEPVFTSAPTSAPCGVAVSGSHLYWADLEANMIGRARIDGGGAEPGFIVGAARPCGVAVEGPYIYWANSGDGSIGRARLDGSEVDQRFVAGLGGPCGIDVSPAGIFWGDWESESIGRAGLDGGGAIPKLVPGAGEPWDVAVDATHVYWADRVGGGGPNLVAGIARATLTGAAAGPLLAIGVDSATGVAVDETVLPRADVPRLSDYLHFGKLTHVKRTGEVRLDVFVPARGEFRVDAPRVGWRIEKGRPSPLVAGSFRWKLKLWPGKSAAGRKIARKLRKQGRAAIVLRVTYQQEGRLPIEVSKRLAFKRYPRRLAK